MRSSTKHALRLVREADPYGLDKLDGAWRAHTAQKTFRRIVLGSSEDLFLVAEPSSLEQPSTARSFGPRPATVAAFAAAALAIITTAGLLVQHSLNTGSEHTPPAKPTPAATALPTPAVAYGAESQDPNFLKTVTLLQHLVQSVTLPSSAVPTSAPIRGLDAMPLNPVAPLTPSRYEIYSALWWHTTASPSTVSAFLESHRPAGSGEAHATGAYGFPTIIWDLPATPASSLVQVQIDLLASATGTSIKVEADAQWLPSALRPGYITTDVKELHVTITRADRVPTVTKTLTGQAVGRIADALKDVPTMAGGDFSGCGDSEGLTDEITFTAGGHATDIVINLASCLQMLSTYDGKLAETFPSGDAVDKALLKELGLPSTYGF